MTVEFEDRDLLEERYRDRGRAPFGADERLLPGQAADAAAPPAGPATPLRGAPGAVRVPPLADRADPGRGPPRRARSPSSARAAPTRMPTLIAAGPMATASPRSSPTTSRARRASPSVRKIIEIEQRHGFRSSWNFVGDWYPIEAGPVRPRPRRGPRDRPARDQARLQAVREPRQLRRRAAARSTPSWPNGTRSGSARRPPTATPTGWRSWAPTTTAPSPTPTRSSRMGGGCCSILPFFFGEHGRAADHAGPGPHPVGDPARGLDRPLDREDRLDRRQRWPRQPDHASRLPRHAGAAAYVRGIPRAPRREEGGWNALPRDVASWWRTRRDLELVVDGRGAARVEGEGAARARIEWIRDDEPLPTRPKLRVVGAR